CHCRFHCPSTRSLIEYSEPYAHGTPRQRVLPARDQTMIDNRPLSCAIMAIIIGLMGEPVQAKTPLVVVAALNQRVATPLLQAFRKSHPHIKLQYHDYSTLQVDRYARQARPVPDIVISSAMPRQMALVNAGFAQPLHSPQAK